jgi:hypothetical protein
MNVAYFSFRVNWTTGAGIVNFTGKRASSLLTRLQSHSPETARHADHRLNRKYPRNTAFAEINE